MSAFLSTYLEQKMPGVLRKKLPNLYFDDGTYCPQVADIQVGAESLSVEVVQHYGQASIMAGAAQDAPMTEVTIGKDIYRIVHIFGATSYSDPEIRAAEFATSRGQTVTNITDERLIAMRRMIDERSHLICAYGSAKHDIFGVLNHPQVPLSNDSTVKLYKSDTTSKAIIDFVSDGYYAVWQDTNFLEAPNILFVSPEAFKLFNTTYRSDNTDRTLMNILKDVLPDLQAIVALRELTSARLEGNGVHTAGTGKDRMMFANLSPDNYKRHFSPIFVMPPSQKGMKYDVFGYKSVSSVQFDYPKSARYIDYPIAIT
jgi:hypothetical protein